MMKINGYKEILDLDQIAIISRRGKDNAVYNLETKQNTHTLVYIIWGGFQVYGWTYDHDEASAMFEYIPCLTSQQLWDACRGRFDLRNVG